MQSGTTLENESRALLTEPQRLGSAGHCSGLTSTQDVTTAAADETDIQEEEHRASDRHIGRVLPLAFTTAFAIAATSATSLYAYATLMCENPHQCKDEEKKKYTGMVATANVLANAFGVVAVFVLRGWAETRPKLGLCFWLVNRSLGVGSLALGVVRRSIYVAIMGRIFEGLANDNLLHYALAAIYVQTNDHERFSRLMGTSLALYMVGMALSPTIMSLLPDFFLSFVVAILVLVSSLCYLGLFVPHVVAEAKKSSEVSSDPGTTIGQLYATLTSPILSFFKDQGIVLPALALLLYNTTQSYLFPLIMVHSTLKFGFTSVQNGYIVSLAASTSSLYLLIVFYIVPKLQSTARQPEQNSNDGAAEHARPQAGIKAQITSDWFYAMISMLVQCMTLLCYVAIQTAYMVYVMVVFTALGLAAPSFIKSYTVSIAEDKGHALACLVVMETLGGMLSPIILGSAQSTIGNLAFFVASGMVAAAMTSLMISVFVRQAG